MRTSNQRLLCLGILLIAVFAVAQTQSLAIATVSDGGGQSVAGSQGAQYGSGLSITDGPRVEFVNSNSAQIAWTTSESAPNSFVVYGTSPQPSALTQTVNAGAESPASSGTAGHMTHRATISGLQPHTTYYFAVDSRVQGATSNEAKSPINQFTTK